MGFQLVRASDTEIAIWETEQGHVFLFQVGAGADGLWLVHTREAPDAARPAADFAAGALVFATAEARSRQLIRETPRPAATAESRHGAL